MGVVIAHEPSRKDSQPRSSSPQPVTTTGFCVWHLVLSVFLDRKKVVNDDLGNFLKISVRCQNRKPVLHGAGGNPDIGTCHRSSALLEEGSNDGPSIRSFVVNC